MFGNNTKTSRTTPLSTAMEAMAAVAVEIAITVETEAAVATETDTTTVINITNISPRRLLPVLLIRLPQPPVVPTTAPTPSTMDPPTLTLPMGDTKTMWPTTNTTSKPPPLSSNNNKLLMTKVLHHHRPLLPTRRRRLLPRALKLLLHLRVPVAIVQYVLLSRNLMLNASNDCCDLGSAPSWLVISVLALSFCMKHLPTWMWFLMRRGISSKGSI